jgi:hypothetical protein
MFPDALLSGKMFWKIDRLLAGAEFFNTISPKRTCRPAWANWLDGRGAMTEG